MRLYVYLATAGLAVSTMYGPSVQAADLIGKLRQTIKPKAHEDGTIRWYLRGDISNSRFNEPDTNYTVVSVVPNIGPIDLRREMIRKVWGASLGAGFRYRFARFDITYEKRRKTRYLGYAPPFNDWNHAGPFPVPARRDHYDFNSHTIMANGYLDLGTWLGVTPYVGAGIGATRFSTSGNYVSEPLPLTAALGGLTQRIAMGSRKTWSLSWAMMAGLSYSFTHNIKIDIGYRFAHLGSLKFNHVNPATGAIFTTFKTRKIRSHDLRIGIRYEFGRPTKILPKNTFTATPAHAFGRTL